MRDDTLEQHCQSVALFFLFCFTNLPLLCLRHWGMVFFSFLPFNSALDAPRAAGRAIIRARSLRRQDALER